MSESGSKSEIVKLSFDAVYSRNSLGDENLLSELLDDDRQSKLVEDFESEMEDMFKFPSAFESQSKITDTQISPLKSPEINYVPSISDLGIPIAKKATPKLLAKEESLVLAQKENEGIGRSLKRQSRLGLSLSDFLSSDPEIELGHQSNPKLERSKSKEKYPSNGTIVSRNNSKDEKRGLMQKLFHKRSIRIRTATDTATIRRGKTISTSNRKSRISQFFSSAMSLSGKNDVKSLSRDNSARVNIGIQESPTVDETKPDFAAPKPGVRRYITEEILETEKSYLDSLKIIIDKFQKPLTEACKRGKPIMALVDIKIIFTHIPELLSFTERFLGEIQIAMAKWDDETTILGDTFLNNIENFQIYTKFVDNYAAAKAALRRADDTILYKTFNAECMQNRECLRQGLADFMVFPIQRVARYVLLLQDLKKYTSTEHPDSTYITRALEEMQKLAKTVNDAKRKEEDMTKTFMIQKTVENCPPTIISATRRFIVEKNAINGDDFLSRPIKLFVFSDLILVAKQKHGKSRFAAMVPLKMISFEEIENKNCLRVLIQTNKGKSISQIWKMESKQDIHDLLQTHQHQLAEIENENKEH